MLVRLYRALFRVQKERRFAPRPSRRLGLERLEDRWTPASPVWVGNGVGAGANWSVPTNWSTNKAPTSGDTVIFDGTAGVGANTNSTMNLGGVGSFHIASLVFRNNYAKTLTLNANLIVDVFNMGSPATITGKSLTINQTTEDNVLPAATLFGASFWTKGTISSSLALQGESAHPATFNIGDNTGGTISLQANFYIADEDSTVNWKDNDVTVAAGKTVDNSGVFNADADGKVFGNSLGAGNKWTFENNKTLNLGKGKFSNETLTPGVGSKVRKVSSATPGASTFEITDAIVLAALATIEVDSGTLQLDGSLTQSDGIVQVASSANPTASLTVGGTLTQTGGSLEVDYGTITVASSVSLSGGTATVNYGTLAVTGTSSLSGGTFTISAGTLQSTGDVDILSGGTLAGIGQITTGGTLDNAGTITINSSGTTGLSVTGNYTQTGTLNMQIGSNHYPAGLHVSGLATLGGTLHLTMLPGYNNPWPGANFQIVTYGSVSGSFAVMNLPTPFYNGTWQGRFNDPAYPNAFSLWVV